MDNAAVGVVGGEGLSGIQGAYGQQGAHAGRTGGVGEAGAHGGTQGGVVGEGAGHAADGVVDVLDHAAECVDGEALLAHSVINVAGAAVEAGLVGGRGVEGVQAGVVEMRWLRSTAGRSGWSPPRGQSCRSGCG